MQIVFHGDGKTAGRVYVLGTNSMEDLEAWMKLIASSSYDYMKLMVVELQHQLSELEEREKIQQQQQQQSTSAPEVPPRTRTNPFNTSSQSGGRGKRKGWFDIHRELGKKILADRQKWRESKAENPSGNLLIDI